MEGVRMQKDTQDKEHNLSEARRWLDKALALEAEGKSEKMVSMALDKAVKFENAAFA